jgi:hypothetical protein
MAFASIVGHRAQQLPSCGETPAMAEEEPVFGNILLHYTT